MKKKSPILFMLSLFLTVHMGAQNSDHPFKFSFSSTSVDYNNERDYFSDLFDTLGTDDWNTNRILNRVTFGGSLNPSFALEGSISLMALSTIPRENPTRGNWWIDIDATLNYHFANGYIFSEHSCIDPYIFAGTGLNMLEHRNSKAIGDEDAGVVWDVHMEPKIGVGADVWFMEQCGLFVQTGYAFMGVNGYDYAQHSVGVILRFGKGRDADDDGVADWEDMCPDKPGSAKFSGCPDTDDDGIIDGNDACPYDGGLSDLRGCPDTDSDGIADKDDTCPAEKGTAEFNGCPDNK